MVIVVIVVGLWIFWDSVKRGYPSRGDTGDGAGGNGVTRGRGYLAQAKRDSRPFESDNLHYVPSNHPPLTPQHGIARLLGHSTCLEKTL